MLFWSPINSKCADLKWIIQSDGKVHFLVRNLFKNDAQNDTQQYALSPDNMQEKYLINALTCRHCLIHNNNQHDKVILQLMHNGEEGARSGLLLTQK